MVVDVIKKKQGNVETGNWYGLKSELANIYVYN